jgi:hypothetical protein
MTQQLPTERITAYDPSGFSNPVYHGQAESQAAAKPTHEVWLNPATGEVLVPDPSTAQQPTGPAHVKVSYEYGPGVPYNFTVSSSDKIVGAAHGLLAARDIAQVLSMQQVPAASLRELPQQSEPPALPPRPDRPSMTKPTPAPRVEEEAILEQPDDGEIQSDTLADANKSAGKKLRAGAADRLRQAAADRSERKQNQTEPQKQRRSWAKKKMIGAAITAALFLPAVDTGMLAATNLGSWVFPPTHWGHFKKYVLHAELGDFSPTKPFNVHHK